MVKKIYLNSKIKENDEENLQPSTLVENFNNMYIGMDVDGIITNLNKRAENIFGNYISSIIGKSFLILIPPTLQDEMQILLSKLKTGEIEAVVDHSVYMMRHDGVKIELARSIFPNKNNDEEIIGFSIVSHDLIEHRRREEEYLKKNIDRYKSLFVFSRDAIMTIEPPTWEFTSANPATLKMFGVENDYDFLNREPWVWSPEFQPDGRQSGEKAKEMIEKAMNEGINFFEWTHVRLDGEEFPSEVLLSKLELGENSYLNATVRDITIRRKLENKLKIASTFLEEKIKYRTSELANAKAQDDAILSSIGDAVAACDIEGKIILFNHIAAELLGFSLNDVIGKHYSQILVFVTADLITPSKDYVDQAIREGRIIIMPSHSHIIKKNGTKIPISSSSAPIFDESGVVVGCVMVFRDTTRDYNIDKAKTEFVSLASHQLRTPLTSIGWLSQMLLGGDFGEINDKQTNAVNMINKSSLRMSELISALLNTSRLELGTFAIVPSSIIISELSDESLFELESEIKNKNIKITKDYIASPSIINADPILLKIILQNLLTNAVHYTLPESEITIKIEKDHYYYLITVSDNGIGIPKKEQSQIFSKLFRASNAQIHKTDGNGLGLYLIRSIVDVVGGQIWFHSEEGKGTNFYVALPLEGMVARGGASLWK